ncbi:MAG: hypothetical protein M9921_14240 [Fimbriimonadaceae bacterium]|nr:hypothetical protein [Chthonomonadaceae bacterium]MCO5298005.1 hypothetical protein [Fimbriimonadaceae bacterium]
MRYFRLVLQAGFAAGGAIAGALTANSFMTWLFRMAQSRSDPTAAFEVPSSSVVAMAVLGTMIGVGIGTMLARLFYRFLEQWDRMDSGDKVTLFLGIFAGLVASSPFLFLFNAIFATAYVPFAIFGLTLGFATLSVYALQSMSEVLPWTKGKARGRRRGIKILDTNVIIDGRVYDVARTGFLEGQLYVPGFVLEELQHIADSHDPLRRQRGRRGLDVLRHLQSDFPLEVRIHDRLVPEDAEVDSRLVALAKVIGADIVTNDFNLNRVAALQEVKVLNLNDLALSMRPNVLPKERLTLTIIREGNQVGQGVGYLEDGTMVVVESGREHLGETMDVVVTQVIQTERGKMIFAELPSGEETEDDPAPSRRKPRYRNS